MRKLLAISALLIASPAVAATSDYWLVAENQQDNSFTYVDASTITGAGGNTRSAWITVVNEGSEIAKDGYKSATIKSVFDCAGRKYTTVDEIEYDAEGSVTKQNENMYVEYIDLVPHTVGAAEADFVCADPSSWAGRGDFSHLTAMEPSESADFLYKIFHRSERPRAKRKTPAH